MIANVRAAGRQAIHAQAEAVQVPERAGEDRGPLTTGGDGHVARRDVVMQMECTDTAFSTDARNVSSQSALDQIISNSEAGVARSVPAVALAESLA